MARLRDQRRGANPTSQPKRESRRLRFHSLNFSLSGAAAFAACSLACTGELGSGSGGEGLTAAERARAAGEESPDGGSAIPQVGSPGHAAVPRLTVTQYRSTVNSLWGDSIEVPALESDNRPDFFSVIGAARQPITETGVALFWEASKSIGEQVAADPALREATIPCGAAPMVDVVCVQEFLENVGTRLFRRPLSVEEMNRYTDLFIKSAEDDLAQGLRYTLTALLSSPAFLYRHEQTVATDSSVGEEYSDYALASRLAFLVTNQAPDEELLALAQAGDLRDPAVLSEQLDRLYAEGAEHGLETFFEEYFDLEATGILDFEGASPEEDQVIGESMRVEARLMALHAIHEGEDYRDLFTTPDTQLNGPLASLYGVPGITGEAMVPYSFTEDAPRAGLLTTGAFLTVDAAQERTKPSNRGLYIQFRLRCEGIPDPPDDIPPLDDIADPAVTSVREILEQHRADPTCAGCHDAMDPLGIAMEDFDQFGRFRTNYPDGAPVDAGSELNGVQFSGAKQLGAALSDDEMLTRCLVKQVYRYTNARVEESSEAPYLDEIYTAFSESGFQFKELLRAIIRSEGFLLARPEEVSP